MHLELEKKGKIAKKVSKQISQSSTREKNEALKKMAEFLVRDKGYIIEANKADLENARMQNFTNAFVDRLTLNEARIEQMAEGLLELVNLEDPIGKSDNGWITEDEIEIHKVRVPLGVIGIIYEARPNVTADAAGLCLKSGNAVILRGSKDAIESNKAIVEVLQKALEESNLPNECIQLIEDTSRETANEMMRLNEFIDVLIPRGGQGLINAVVKNSTVPVIETGVGNCHAYVSKNADFKMALDIIENGKTQRPGVCNALETVLVDEEIANEFLPALNERLSVYPVEIRGCEKTVGILTGAIKATDEDFKVEFLDYVLAAKVVGSLDEAIEHIDVYGTKHSEVIITNDYAETRSFQGRVDAAAVYVNASTRFTDGNKFGFGAEIGISTQKLHARGPMGLEHLTSIKYLVNGSGQIRS